MKDKALAQAKEVLQAITDQFDLGANCIFRSAHLFDDDESFGEHVNTALRAVNKALSPDPALEVIPRSRRYRIVGYLGKWSGWQGKRKIADFGTNEPLAHIWLGQKEAENGN